MVKKEYSWEELSKRKPEALIPEQKEFDYEDLVPKASPQIQPEMEWEELVETQPKPQATYQDVNFKGAGAGMAFPFEGKVRTDLDVDIKDLSSRVSKHVINFLPTIVKKFTSPKGFMNKQVIKLQSHLLAKSLYKDPQLSDVVDGKPVQSFKEFKKDLQDEMVQSMTNVQAKIPQLQITPPEGLQDKIVDISAGVGQFVAELAVLKRFMPKGTPVWKVWEMQNLMSQGTPGAGATTSVAFTGPAKLIKDAGKLKEAARIGLQSVGLAGITALESKIDEGRIDRGEVLTAAAFPLGIKVGGKVLKGMGKVLFDPLKPSTLKLKAIKAGLPTTLSSSKQTVSNWVDSAKITETPLRVAANKALKRRMHVIYNKVYTRSIKKGIPTHKAQEMAARARAGQRSAVREVEPLKLSKGERQIFGKAIDDAYATADRSFQHAGAHDAFKKMVEGKLPTPYDFVLLEPVLGAKLTAKLARKSEAAFELVDAVPLIRDGLKAMLFGFDPQSARGLSKTGWRHPINYSKAVFRNIQAYVSATKATKLRYKIENSYHFNLAKNDYGINTLSMSDFGTVEMGNKLEQYGHFSKVLERSRFKPFKGLGRWLHASERGANIGMNTGITGLVNIAEKDLARYGGSILKRTGTAMTKGAKIKWRLQRGSQLNAFTKRIAAKSSKGKDIQKAANYILFSPAYTVSGPVADFKAVINLATGQGLANKTMGMQMLGTQIAGLTGASWLISQIGQKQRLNTPSEEPDVQSSANPFNPLWGKVRKGTEVYGLGFGDLAHLKLLARVGMSAYMKAKEMQTGEQVTEALGKKQMGAGEAIARFAVSKRTLYLSLADQLATGKDFMGKDITLKDTLLENLPFEFFASFIEAGMVDGTWESMESGIKHDEIMETLKNVAPAITALGGLSTSSYEVSASSTRRKFKDIIAERNYNKKWDVLTPGEQLKLRRGHKQQLAVLDNIIRQQNVDTAPSLERRSKEETEAGQRVRKIAGPTVQAEYGLIDLGLSRIRQDFYMNDKRYNKYQSYVALNLRTKLAGKILKTDELKRVKQLELYLKLAKDKAWFRVRREMRNGR